VRWTGFPACSHDCVSPWEIASGDDNRLQEGSQCVAGVPPVVAPGVLPTEATGSPVGRWALPRVRSKPYLYVVGSAHPTVIENGARSQLSYDMPRAMTWGVRQVNDENDGKY
jgi:hypothetical protein